MCFFFFQAEDGIRDGHVTGVQTCALPIFLVVISGMLFGIFFYMMNVQKIGLYGILKAIGMKTSKLFQMMWTQMRSEERRVGKECRTRWLTSGQKKEKG